jgi:hypothetical protein
MARQHITPDGVSRLVALIYKHFTPDGVSRRSLALAHGRIFRFGEL